MSETTDKINEGLEKFRQRHFGGAGRKLRQHLKKGARKVA